MLPYTSEMMKMMMQSMQYYANHPDAAKQSLDELQNLTIANIWRWQSAWVQSMTSSLAGSSSFAQAGKAKNAEDTPLSSDARKRNDSSRAHDAESRDDSVEAHNATQNMTPEKPEPPSSDEVWLKVDSMIAHDRRFSHPAWRENALLRTVLAQYIATNEWVSSTVARVDSDSEELSRRLFFATLIMDALSPANFLLTNPDAMEEWQKTKGQSLARGAQNFFRDLQRDQSGGFSLTTSDEKAFTVGENLAHTPGWVIYRNDLIELIEYQPQTDKVSAEPLLIVPPWINKYYILDLSQQKSLVRWLVEQQQRVFLISWVNPDQRHRDCVLADYLNQGVLAAMDVIGKRLGQGSSSGGGGASSLQQHGINVMGYCVGGTMTCLAMAYLAKNKQRAAALPTIKSATLLTTLTDFSDCGQMRAFLSKEQRTVIKSLVEQKGYLDGRDMALTFSLLRANDLIWSFARQQYLMGKDVASFDIMYWNSDNTSLAGKAYVEYIDNFYVDNQIIKPNAYVIDKTPIDLRMIKVPIMMVSTMEDHIAPWQSTFALTQQVKGEVTFVLGESGHVVGIINPPTKKKYAYYEAPIISGQTPIQWQASAQKTEGSWWPRWYQWIAERHGRQKIVSTPAPPKKVIAKAPGTYVHVRQV